jgi:hypothetical protein
MDSQTNEGECAKGNKCNQQRPCPTCKENVKIADGIFTNLESIFAKSIERAMRALGKQICPQCVIADVFVDWRRPERFPSYLGDGEQHFWCRFDDKTNRRKLLTLYTAAYDLVDKAAVVSTWLSEMDVGCKEKLGISAILQIALHYMDGIENCCSLAHDLRNAVTVLVTTK